jgi:hypothetical protein
MLAIGAESFVFQFAIQKFKDQDIPVTVESNVLHSSVSFHNQESLLYSATYISSYRFYYMIVDFKFYKFELRRLPLKYGYV